MAVYIPTVKRFRNLGKSDLVLGVILDLDPLETLILGQVLAGDLIFRVFRIYENPLILDSLALDLDRYGHGLFLFVRNALGLLYDFPLRRGQSLSNEGENEAKYQNQAYDTLHVERLLHLNAIYCRHINIL